MIFFFSFVVTYEAKHREFKQKVFLHSVGIEPTLLRTRALSVRLNRSAKSA